MSDKPKRDVSARKAIGKCDHSGGNAVSTLSGEHIWKCSEVVPKAQIEQYIDGLRNDSERRSHPGFDTRTAESIASDLDEMIE